MDNNIKKILIVGGGTAGWLSALFLKQHLGEHIHITLIESPNIPTIGAGEATIPGMVDFIDKLGIDEEDFLVSCNATFKFGIKYTHWTDAKNENPIWHPFFYYDKLHPSIADLYFLQRDKLKSKQSLADFWYPDMPFIEANKAPRKLDENPYFWDIAYAYHFDNHLLAKFFAKIAKERNIEHISDTVTDIQMHDEKHIQSVHTESNGKFEADIFIDCSGFRRIMIEKKLKASYTSIQDKILCDRALAVKVPYKDKKKELECFTTVKGMNSGWMWRIPLYENIGYGYVHSSQHISEEKALEEFSQTLGISPDDYNYIPMQNGYLEESWIGNCIAVGLSSNFIEPLESTGLYFVTYTLNTLLDHFPSSTKNLEMHAKPYNKLLLNLFKSVLTFVYMHYHSNDREDTPFWRDNKYNPSKDRSLDKIYDNFCNLYGKPAVHAMLPGQTTFNDPSYTFLFEGLGVVPKEPSPLMAYERFQKMAEIQQKASLEQSKRLEGLPDIIEFLDHIHKKKSGYV